MKLNYNVVTHPAEAKFIQSRLEHAIEQQDLLRKQQHEIDVTLRDASMNNTEVETLADIQATTFANHTHINSLDVKISELRSALSQLRHTPHEAYKIVVGLFPFAEKFDLNNHGGVLSFLNSTASWIESPAQKEMRIEFFNKTGIVLTDLIATAQKVGV